VRDALRRERAVKSMSKPTKEALVAAAVIAVADNAPSG
jgi:predicted GIY-YIG superfamily endonuclease